MAHMICAVEAAVLPQPGGLRSSSATERPVAASRSARIAPMIPDPRMATSTGPAGSGAAAGKVQSASRQGTVPLRKFRVSVRVIDPFAMVTP